MLCFKKIIDIWNAEFVVIFEQGKFRKPLLILDKAQIKELTEELKEKRYKEKEVDFVLLIDDSFKDKKEYDGIEIKELVRKKLNK